VPRHTLSGSFFSPRPPQAVSRRAIRPRQIRAGRSAARFRSCRNRSFLAGEHDSSCGEHPAGMRGAVQSSAAANRLLQLRHPIGLVLRDRPNMQFTTRSRVNKPSSKYLSVDRLPAFGDVIHGTEMDAADGCFNSGQVDNFEATPDGSVKTEIEDPALTHLQLVMTAKLRRGEPFSFAWREDLSVGGGRTTCGSTLVARSSSSITVVVNRRSTVNGSTRSPIWRVPRAVFTSLRSRRTEHRRKSSAHPTPRSASYVSHRRSVGVSRRTVEF